MQITLKCTVKVQTFSVQMTIYEEDKSRSEIIPLLKAIVEAEEEGKIPLTYMKEKLFPELPLTFIKNIMEELRLMGLVENGELTERGELTIQSKEVMIPRTGSYRIDVVDDPLFERVIVNYDPLTPNLEKELLSKENNDSRSVIIPDFILDTIDHKIETIEQITRKIEIKNIQENGYFNEKNYYLEFSLVYNNNFWDLKVRNKGYSTSIEKPSLINESQIIETLLKKISSKADLNQLRIPVNPENLTVTELVLFKKDYQLNNVSFDQLGEFNSATLKEIEIYPEDDSSATKWAEKLFLERLSSYIVQHEFEKMWTDLIHEFPILGEFDIHSPSIGQLSQQITFGSAKYWFLKAPRDMELEEVVEK